MDVEAVMDVPMDEMKDVVVVRMVVEPSMRIKVEGVDLVSVEIQVDAGLAVLGLVFVTVLVTVVDCACVVDTLTVTEWLIVDVVQMISVRTFRRRGGFRQHGDPLELEEEEEDEDDDDEAHESLEDDGEEHESLG